MEVSLSPGDFVLDGNPTLPFSRRGGAPNFLPTSIVAKRLHGSRYHLVWRYRPRPTRIYCVRCGPSYPQKKGTPTPPVFVPCLLWPNGWMDEDAAWHTEVDLGSCRIVLDGVPAPSKGAQQLPSFLLWPQVAHLNYCRALVYCIVLLTLFGRVGRIASEEVVLNLIWTKYTNLIIPLSRSCMPVNENWFKYYSLDFVVNRFCMKLFQTGNIDVVKCCQSYFCFELHMRARKFDLRYRNHLNLFCQMISYLWIALYSSIISIFSHCRCSLCII